MITSAQSEKRRERRQRVLKGATIVTDVNESEVACMIRNMHSQGAEIRVPADQLVPNEFLLCVSLDKQCYRCRVCWRINDRIGVAFQGTAQKPKWHYGQ